MTQCSKLSKIPIKTLTVDKCSQCIDSKCCQYITEPMDTPRSIKSFDMLLWQVSHANVHIFKDSTGWYLTCFGQCEHLSPQGQCSIYEKRPLICREHSSDHCEFDNTHDSYCDLYFTNYTEFDKYCREKFKHWDKRFN